MAIAATTRAPAMPSATARAVTIRRPIYMASGITVAAVCAASVVWFLGLDIVWAAATVIVAAPVSAALIKLKFDEDAGWERPEPTTARGSRIAMATLEKSLVASDRLARPALARRIRAIVISEREDQLARPAALRRVRALLAAELLERGQNPADRQAVVTLLGPDALIILQPIDGTPVTSAAIARCLDAVERLIPRTHGSA